jgi:DNA-directed RNA polymerase subunit RPC12/RpoP
LEKERIEKEKLEKERIEKERVEKEKLEKEKQEKEKQEREEQEREKQEREKQEREKQEIEKTIAIKSKFSEEEKRANIFDGICPHCKKKSEGMEKGNIRKCNFCGYVYDIQNNFKEYNREEWIIKNKPPVVSQEYKISDTLNNVCPNCKRKGEGIGKGNALKCDYCKKVFDILDKLKEYSLEEWKMNNLFNNKLPKCLNNVSISSYNKIKCSSCNIIYDMNTNDIKEYVANEWENFEKKRRDIEMRRERERLIKKKKLNEIEKKEGIFFKFKRFLCDFFDVNVEDCPYCNKKLIKVNNNIHKCNGGSNVLVFENNNWIEYF